MLDKFDKSSDGLSVEIVNSDIDKEEFVMPVVSSPDPIVPLKNQASED